MKTELLILLILYVFNAAKTEFRHHQDRFSRDNFTTYPWFSTLQHKSEEKTVTEITKLKHQGAVTTPEDSFHVVPSIKMKPLYAVSKFLQENREFYPTESVFSANDNNEETEEKRKVYFLNEESKSAKLTNKYIELETSTGSLSFEKSKFYFLSPILKKKRNGLGFPDLADPQIINSNEGKTYNESRRGKINFANSSFKEASILFQNGRHREQKNDLNLFRGNSDLRLAEPLVALTDDLESDKCVENVVEDFILSDDLVTDVLTDRNEAEKLTSALVSSNDGLDGMTDKIESVMEKHPRITSISVLVLNEGEKSKMSQTVYRKENDLFVDRESIGYPKFLTGKKSSWTPLFWHCLTKTWIFGYSFIVDNGDKR